MSWKNVRKYEFNIMLNRAERAEVKYLCSRGKYREAVRFYKQCMRRLQRRVSRELCREEHWEG